MRIKTVSALNGEAIRDWLATSLHLAATDHSGKKCVISKIDFPPPAWALQEEKFGELNSYS